MIDSATNVESIEHHAGRILADYLSRLDFTSSKTSELPASEQAQLLVTLRNVNEKIEAATKPLADLAETLAKATLPASFEREGVTTFTTANGYRVTISTRMYASVLPGCKDAAMEWLKANNLGDIIQPTVNASTLSGVAKTLLEEGRELPEDLFRAHYQPAASVTKVSAKAK